MLKPLFKGLKVAPFVECPNCHIRTEYGKENCLSCSAALNLSKDQMIYFVVLNMGAQYTPFVECPNCLKLVRVGVRRCPDCYEEIPEKYALASAIAIVTNTIAVNVAASLKSLDAFAVLAVILSALFYLYFVYVSEWPNSIFIIFIWPIQPLILILLWFYRFGRFTAGDEEYLQAKQHMKRSLILWLAIVAVQSLAIAGLWIR